MAHDQQNIKYYWYQWQWGNITEQQNQPKVVICYHKQSKIVKYIKYNQS